MGRKQDTFHEMCEARQMADNTLMCGNYMISGNIKDINGIGETSRRYTDRLK
jgi:hypothetical protein